ncbi:MAG: hypothetical protein IKL50_06045 [Bacteroidales bacterium]|nr:hypothetical protein [Bacteroidales bacterium]
MKKLLLAIAILIGAPTSISVLADNNNINISELTESCPSYNFVGNFMFYNENGRSTQNWDIYEASNACGSYYVDIYGTKHKLFPVQGHNLGNYYVSMNGGKWYVSI